MAPLTAPRAGRLHGDAVMRHSDDLPRRPRLPDLMLPALAGGGTVPLREHRHGSAIVLLGETVRPDDVRWLGELAAHERALRDWDGRVLVVAGPDTDVEPVTRLGLPFPMVRDAEGRVARAAGLEAPALVLADLYGEVFATAPAGAGAPWMSVADVEEWLRLMAIRCG